MNVVGKAKLSSSSHDDEDRRISRKEVVSEGSGQTVHQSRIIRQHPLCPKTLYLHPPQTAQTEGRLVSVGFLALDQQRR